MKRYILLLFLLISPLFAQRLQNDHQNIKSRYGYDIQRYPSVAFNFFVDYETADWKPRMYISVAIQNDFLQFTLNDDFFTSEYETTIQVKHDTSDIVFQETWLEKAELPEFELTNSRQDFQKNVYSFTLKDEQNNATMIPGIYEILLEVKDLKKSKSYKNTRKFRVSKEELKQGKNRHTQVAFLSGGDNDNKLPEALSATKKMINYNQPYTAYARIYSEGNTNLTFITRLFRKVEKNKTIVQTDSISAISDSENVFHLLYPLPYKNMSEGDYLLQFTAIEEPDFVIKRPFSTVWFNKPLYLYKVDLAIRPMEYLLDEQEYEKVEDMSFEDQVKWFKDYWKQRDPTPDTEFNELLEVYFSRVSESVKRFSTRFKEGWQTDCGMVLLMYGEPHEIENRKYSSNTFPHIIWHYTIDETNLTFTFIDELKSGEYVLVDEKME